MILDCHVHGESPGAPQPVRASGPAAFGHGQHGALALALALAVALALLALALLALLLALALALLVEGRGVGHVLGRGGGAGLLLEGAVLSHHDPALHRGRELPEVVALPHLYGRALVDGSLHDRRVYVVVLQPKVQRHRGRAPWSSRVRPGEGLVMYLVYI